MGEGLQGKGEGYTVYPKQAHVGRAQNQYR